MFAKTIHPSLSMTKTFSLYTYIPIHNKLFLYTRTLKTFSLYINMVYKNPIPVQWFLFSFFNIHSWFYTKNFFIYPHCSHTRIAFITGLNNNFILYFVTLRLYSFIFFLGCCWCMFSCIWFLLLCSGGNFWSSV